MWVCIQETHQELHAEVECSDGLYLMELELEAKHVAEGLVLAHVGLDKRDEELIVVRATLIHL